MKKSVILPKQYPRIELNASSLVIPKSKSQSQFFNFEGKRKKRRSHKLCTSSVRTTNTSYRYGSDSSPKQTFQPVRVSANLSQLFGSHKMSAKTLVRSASKPNVHSYSPGPASRVNPATKHSIFKNGLADSLELGSGMSGHCWKIDDFRVIAKIGEGSTSSVYLVLEKKSHFLCVLKKIKKSIVQDQKAMEAVIRELKIHHFFDHDNIVKMYGEFSDQHNIYILQQYCENGDLHKQLRKKIQNSEQTSVEQAADIIKQVCLAVEEMHRNLVIHRDIKPENIFLTAGNKVKLGDFGCSVACGDSRMRSTRCGTPLYFAPEMIEQKLYTETVDIWAIGVLSFEILTGESPFNIRDCGDLGKMMKQQIKFQYIENETARDFVMKLLQKNVEMRMDIEDILMHPFLKLANS